MNERERGGVIVSATRKYLTATNFREQFKRLADRDDDRQRQAEYEEDRNFLHVVLVVVSLLPLVTHFPDS